MITFGPIPSRRLGKSLGINHIPPKTCSYDCIYCQVGRTKTKQVQRMSFYQPDEILKHVKMHIQTCGQNNEHIDYLTLVADGEPILDLNLGQIIGFLKPLGIKIAVITNGSLLWQEEVRKALMKSDYVSIKVDTVQHEIWKRINRPHHMLNLPKILDGMKTFSATYQGRLTTETMLIQNMNDHISSISETADFISDLYPYTAYLSLPIRPPAESWACSPAKEMIVQAYQVFQKKITYVEHLFSHPEDSFSTAEDIERTLINIASVHPLRKQDILELLSKSKSNWAVVTSLLKKGHLIEKKYEGEYFYLAKQAE